MTAPTSSHLLLRSLVVILLATILPACSPAPIPPSSPTVGPKQEIATITATPFHFQDEVLIPARFLLPSPGPEPVSGWRAPLYPVPWAISLYDHFYLLPPMAADEVNWPSPTYRYGGILFGTHVHTGIDIPARKNAPVLAAGPGQVVWAGWGFNNRQPDDIRDPYGLAISIRHDFGYQGQPLYTVYAHLSAIEVNLYQHVESGQVIGYIGDTGHATGPHLHFEVRVGKNLFSHTRNPELWLVPSQGHGVLAGAILDQNGKPLRHVYVQVRSDTSTYSSYTYGPANVNPDDHYQENLVIGNLPAGPYQVIIPYENRLYRFWLEVFPGQITYFTYRPKYDFQVIPLPIPTSSITVPSLLPTPRP